MELVKFESLEELNKALAVFSKANVVVRKVKVLTVSEKIVYFILYEK